MKIYDIEKVRNPIIYISIALILGSLFWGMYNNKYIWLAVLTVSLFFIVTYLNSNFSFLSIIILFFVLGIFNNFNYYNLRLREGFTGDIIIVEAKPYYKMGNYKGRLVYIEGTKDEVKIGHKINVTGKFCEKIDFERVL